MWPRLRSKGLLTHSGARPWTRAPRPRGAPRAPADARRCRALAEDAGGDAEAGAPESAPANNDGVAAAGRALTAQLHAERAARAAAAAATAAGAAGGATEGAADGAAMVVLVTHNKRCFELRTRIGERVRALQEQLQTLTGGALPPHPRSAPASGCWQAGQLRGGGICLGQRHLSDLI
jgi:hypothetical protein